MDRMTLRTRLAPTGALGAVLGILLALLLPAGPASAHAALVRTSPPAGSVVDTAPSEVVVTFSEPVRPVTDKIRVIAPDGKRADSGGASTRDRDLRIPLRAGIARGSYLVSFRILSADSHPVSGGYSFSIGEVTATASPNSQSGGAGVATNRVVSVAVSVARYLGYAGLILLVGPTLVLLVLWPRRLSTTGPARLMMVGVGLTALATLLELYLQIPYSSGNGLFTVDSEATRQVLASGFGTAHMIRLGVLIALTILLRPVLGGTANKVDRTMLAILAVVGLATWPISGHPSASTVPTLTVVADVAHLGAMAIWLGGLVMLFGFLLRRANNRELTAILPVWSGWASFAVTVLVLAGTAQALVEIGTVRALFGTGYGRLVLIKVGLLALVLAVAWYSRRMVNTRFTVDPAAEPDAAAEPDPEAGPDAETEPDPGGRTRLRRSVFAEIGIAAVVLVMSSILVQTAPARSADATANAPNQPYSATLSNQYFRLEVDVSPAQSGPNTIHLFAYTPDGGAAQKVVEWKGTAALPEKSLAGVEIPLLSITPDHAVGEVQLPSPGTWLLRFTLRVSDIDQGVVTASVPVR
jgi:copper transport protein